MPRPTTERVIHDYTAKILPATMILTLVIFTVVVLVYSISEKAAVPRDAAVAFAGIVFGFSGLWFTENMNSLKVSPRNFNLTRNRRISLTGNSEKTP
ncbi:hypothetical protein CaCOL14_004255 [Colletotrichum acutatum]